MFDEFYDRKDTFSLGVCNGCQLMALLGWVPWRGIEEIKQPRFIANPSGRLESRWVTVRINKSPSIMLAGMEGSSLGVWINHGEGYFNCPDRKVFEQHKRRQSGPCNILWMMRGGPQKDIPLIPTVRRKVYASLCSPDGRHLAMMPHPERAFLDLAVAMDARGLERRT